jgi:hypothetical protein
MKVVLVQWCESGVFSRATGLFEGFGGRSTEADLDEFSPPWPPSRPSGGGGAIPNAAKRSFEA